MNIVGKVQYYVLHSNKVKPIRIPEPSHGLMVEKMHTLQWQWQPWEDCEMTQIQEYKWNSQGVEYSSSQGSKSHHEQTYSGHGHQLFCSLRQATPES